MKRFWMRSLTGQLIGLMLLALVLSQLAFTFIYRNDRAKSFRDLRREEFLSRAAAVARLVGSTSPEMHREILQAASTSLTRYWITDQAPSDATVWRDGARTQLLRALPVNGSASPATATAASTAHPASNPRIAESDLPLSSPATWSPLPASAWSGGFPAQVLDLESWSGFGLAVAIRSDLWLQVVYAKPDLVTPPLLRSYLYLSVTATLLLVVAVLAARRIARPLQHLTESAERFGRGEDADPVPEEGADDIRQTAAAFNRMQSRIRRFVEDRTRMVAAISHDLRTPITTLRLRAEFIDDPETKDKLIGTLDEMQSMTEAALAFAREEATVEPTRTIDADALIESICDDLAELGWAVKFTDAGRVPWRCRPDALRRALRNLIENAVRYGERAEVRLDVSKDSLDIIVEDGGPGIPEEQFERVFAPFVRLETSRNRATGGVGLGLAIARTIARGHGGDIHLFNRPEGGLRVILRLPRT